jgi:hypothetical protein
MPDTSDEPHEDAQQEMAKDAERMKDRLEGLEEDIDEAKERAEVTREQADPEAGERGER